MGAMGILTSAALSVVLFIASSGLAYAVVQFEDVTAPAGVVTGSAQGSGLASGSAWRDFDGDGLPDLFVGNHYDLPALFRNQGNGTFVDVVPLGVLKRPPDATGIWGDKHGSAWADFDNDGDRDLVIMSGAHSGTGSGAAQLYVSSTEGLVDHAKVLGIDYPLSRKRTATWVDYDNDGRLDLFCGAILRPDGQAPATLFQQTATGFVDVRNATGFEPIDTLGIWISDLNRDGRMELLFRGKKLSPASPNPSRINIIDFDTTTARFRDVTPITFRANFPDLVLADFDGDGRPDIFVANNWEPTATPFGHDLYLNTTSGWVNFTAASGINAISRPSRPSAVAADFDNDMDVDVFLQNGSTSGSLPNVMLWNNGDATFVAEDGAGGAVGHLGGRADAATAADYNVDGFVDLYLTYDGAGTQLYRNGGDGNNWLEIDLQGTISNRDAVGAQVYLTAGGITQLREQNGGIHRYWGQNDQRIHFGLGKNTLVTEIVVGWPSSMQSRLTNVTPNQVIAITEP